MINPALFSVLSIFHIFLSFCRGRIPNFILLMNARLMKQSVAPESISPLRLAIVQLVLTESGIHMEWNRVVTITELSWWIALTQANGFRLLENPPVLGGPSLQGLGPLHVRLLLLEAKHLLIVAGFVLSFVPWWFLLQLRSDHRLLPLFPGFDFCSRCAGGNCNWSVPFGDRCSTQLCLCLS